MNLFPPDKIRKSYKYFTFELTAYSDDQISINSQTIWTGWADDEKRAELRKARLVNPEEMAEYWTNLGIPFMVVNTRNDFIGWFFSGGHALINTKIAAKIVPDWIKPAATVQIGLGGFISVENLPENIFKRAPTKKLRMKILKRDHYRCKICGRRPDDDVDILLHVHHIRPYATRGSTHEDNLITLCHTCHGGLYPHFEWSLYGLINDSSENPETMEKQRYFNGVQRYRKIVRNRMKRDA